MGVFSNCYSERLMNDVDHMKKESQLRDEWSLSKAEIAEHRKEAPAGFVVKEASKRPERLWGYAWTDEGMNWLSERLRVKTVSVVNNDINNIEKIEPVDGIFECKVTRSGFTNTRLVEVEHNGKLIKAACRTNVNIKPRTIVKVRIVGNSACVTEITKKHLINKY